jgi:hypothetical protein
LSSLETEKEFQVKKTNKNRPDHMDGGVRLCRKETAKTSFLLNGSTRKNTERKTKIFSNK